VADQVARAWEVEYIPDDDLLYRRVHRKLLSVLGGARAGAFTDHKGGMSTDWSKYSTPEDTRHRLSGQPPDEFAVAVLPVGEVRRLGLLVEHDPLPENRAHTNVIGDKDAEVRLKLTRICRIVLPIE
jgi:hypothetical protein